MRRTSPALYPSWRAAKQSARHDDVAARTPVSPWSPPGQMPSLTEEGATPGIDQNSSELAAKQSVRHAARLGLRYLSSGGWTKRVCGSGKHGAQLAQ